MTHSLGGYPSVTVVDSAGTVVSVRSHTCRRDQVEVGFSSAFGGTAYLS